MSETETTEHKDYVHPAIAENRLMTKDEVREALNYFSTARDFNRAWLPQWWLDEQNMMQLPETLNPWEPGYGEPKNVPLSKPVIEKRKQTVKEKLRSKIEARKLSDGTIESNGPSSEKTTDSGAVGTVRKDASPIV